VANRKKSAEDCALSASDIVNNRVDKELKGLSRAFTVREQLKADEETEEAERHAHAEAVAAA
jgi:hypothetical protein